MPNRVLARAVAVDPSLGVPTPEKNAPAVAGGGAGDDRGALPDPEEPVEAKVVAHLPPRDPQELHTLGDFFTATQADWRLNKTQTLEKLGVKNDALIGDLAEAYMTVWVALGGGV